ncbi:hypothetical protein HII31_11881 [Pseudocercospora fuligena]|uniref:Uncharacterized protein n=1 Tax=Pseudocercospora fuligena TaxID=685502 RepID=A0A8H6R9B3_9PEZI|nr:hypothetical protein HII31_11881 [Pseudocercospora fuligena]
MATSTDAISREILEAIDENLGQLGDAASQDSLLSDLISQRNLKRTARREHTIDSLRKHLLKIANDHKVGGNGIERIWTLGSRAFKDDYLRSIELEAPSSASAIDGLRDVLPATESQDSGAGERPPTSADSNTKRKAADHAEERAKAKKRTKIAEDEGQVGRSEAQNPDEDGHAGPDSRSAERPSVEELIANARTGRHKTPIDAQLKHVEALARTEGRIGELCRQMFPPGFEVSDKVEKISALNQETLALMMDELFKDVGLIPNILCVRNGLNRMAPAVFVEQPQPQLRSLYQQVLGGEDWYSILNNRQERPSPWRLRVDDVITSMTTAEVYNKVFRAKLPWDLEATLESLGSQLDYVKEAVDDRGYKLSDILKNANYKMADCPKFRKHTISKHARFLANSLAMTLKPHLNHTKATQDLAVNTPGFGSDTKWIDDLTRLFEACIVLKGKSEGHENVEIEYFWMEPGRIVGQADNFVFKPDPRYDEDDVSLQEILLVLWPGMRIKDDGFGGSGVMAQAVKATVLTRILDEHELVPEANSDRSPNGMASPTLSEQIRDELDAEEA